MEITDTRHVRFYYLRDEWDNAPFGCVCTIRTDDNAFFRGISLCNFSRGDRFSKTVGRKISYMRALKGLEYGPKAEPENMMVSLSDSFAEKLNFVWNKYHLGFEGSIPGIESDVNLTEGEKSMWKDIIDPKFEK